MASRQQALADIIASDAEAVSVARQLGERFAADDARRDQDRTIPYDLVEELSRSGLLAITVPREYGGAQVTARTVGAVFTEMASTMPSQMKSTATGTARAKLTSRARYSGPWCLSVASKTR